MVFRVLDLWMLTHSCIPAVSPTWYVILLMNCWNQFAKILFRIFVSVFIGIMVCSFLFVCVIPFLLWGNVGLIKCIWKLSSLIFGRSLRRIDTRSSWKLDRTHSKVFVCWETFDYCVNALGLITSLLKVSISIQSWEVIQFANHF